MTRLDPALQHSRWNKKQLDAEIKACDLCPKLNIPGVTGSAPGYGSLTSPVVLIGQSLFAQCMAALLGELVPIIYKTLQPTA